MGSSASPSTPHGSVAPQRLLLLYQDNEFLLAEAFQRWRWGRNPMLLKNHGETISLQRAVSLDPVLLHGFLRVVTVCR